MWRAKKEGEGKKRGRGEEKGGEGKKKEGKGKKKGEGEEKSCAGKGREYFQRYWGREENIFKGAGEGFQQCYALKPSPAP